MKELAIIGYSGHAYVVCDIFASSNISVNTYFEEVQKKDNPYDLIYLGNERTERAFDYLKNNYYFIAVGNNQIREKIFRKLKQQQICTLTNAIHSNAIVSKSAVLSTGIMLGANATINPLSKIGMGVICNTGCIIEHECHIGAFAHIAPGAVLAGNVRVGERSFIGANSVIKQGVIIGKDVTIGAGSVIINNIPQGVTVVGNPGKIIKHTL